MKVRKAIKTRIYHQCELKFLNQFAASMITFDRLHEIIGNTKLNYVAEVEVESNHVRPSGRKVVAANGCTYFVCGHHRVAE